MPTITIRNRHAIDCKDRGRMPSGPENAHDSVMTIGPLAAMTRVRPLDWPTDLFVDASPPVDDAAWHDAQIRNHDMRVTGGAAPGNRSTAPSFYYAGHRTIIWRAEPAPGSTFAGDGP